MSALNKNRPLQEKDPDFMKPVDFILLIFRYEFQSLIRIMNIDRLFDYAGLF